MRPAAIPLVLALLALPGCDTVYIAASCGIDITPALVATVRDAATNEPLTSGVRAIAREGDWADTTYSTPGGGHDYVLAEGRPGVYTLTVDHAGHATWTRIGLVVRSEGCQIVTVFVSVSMQGA